MCMTVNSCNAACLILYRLAYKAQLYNKIQITARHVVQSKNAVALQQSIMAASPEVASAGKC